jgi:hypothetical protein
MTPTSHRLPVARLLTQTVLVAAILCVVGCGDTKKGGGTSDAVSGKVTLNGQAVSGQVVFITPDGKEHLAPIGEGGSYSIPGVPKGAVRIAVRPLPGGTAIKGGGDLPGTTRGVAPPAKYGTANSGISFDITGGQQTKDIELK